MIYPNPQTPPSQELWDSKEGKVGGQQMGTVGGGRAAITATRISGIS